MNDLAKAQLHLATEAVSVSVNLIRDHLRTIDGFLKDEARLCDDSERQAVGALLAPLFKSARELVTVYDVQAARGRAALNVVNERVG